MDLLLYFLAMAHLFVVCSIVLVYDGEKANVLGLFIKQKLFFIVISLKKSQKHVKTVRVGLLKVSKSQKQIMVSSILPKNEQNSLS